MPGMIGTFLTMFEHWAGILPVEAFAFFGALVEEIIAPIPSPLVMTLAGTAVAVQGGGWVRLVIVCLIGALGKTLGATLYFFLADKAEDWLVPKYGKYIGVTHEDLHKWGELFSNKPKDAFLLFLIRSIPLMPSTPISLLCGIVEMRYLPFFVLSLGGFFLRDGFFMVLGYSGILGAHDALVGQFHAAENILQICIVVVIIAVMGYLWWARKNHRAVKWLKK